MAKIDQPLRIDLGPVFQVIQGRPGIRVGSPLRGSPFAASIPPVVENELVHPQQIACPFHLTDAGPDIPPVPMKPQPGLGNRNSPGVHRYEPAVERQSILSLEVHILVR